MRSSYFFFIVLLSTSLNCTTSSPTIVCNEVRAAFDLGSGATRIKVAEVDTCRTKIVKVLFEQTEKVPYKDDLKAARNFSTRTRGLGLRVLKEMKTKAMLYKPASFRGVATSAFRDARNADSFVEKIDRMLDIKVRIISPREEGIVGFLGASAAVNIPTENMIVWDVGGGSMQITTWDKASGKYSIYEDGVASEPFRDYIIKDIQKKSLKTTSSPNPMGSRTGMTALSYIEKKAAEVPAEIRQKIANRLRVVGVGGVHYYSIRKQSNAGGKSFAQSQVNEAMQTRFNWSDDQIGGKYASTDVSNLILVYGYMKTLGISQVQAVKVNLTDGLLIQNKAWH